jgi:hypothetical protein
MTTGANYFFGFLITFVMLLLIFIACGVCSRRRFLYARRAGQDNLRALGTTSWSSSEPLVQPTFWEAWLQPATPKWTNISVSGHVFQRKHVS